MGKTAILVDGGFYRKRANRLWGKVAPEEEVKRLIHYSVRHLKQHSYGAKKQIQFELYRLFYYDCPPLDSIVFHPFIQKNINMKNTDIYKEMTLFLEVLRSKRKVALRLGELSETQAKYVLTNRALKMLCRKEKSFDDLQEDDFYLSVDQKGVDMKIGIDIASLAYKRQVDQIVLISGDSDFVPAAKLARREGIDFILDSMHTHIKDNLNEHIDGLKSRFKFDCPESYPR